MNNESNAQLNQAEVLGHTNNWLYGIETPEAQHIKVAKSRSGQNFSTSHSRGSDGVYRDGGSWIMQKTEETHTFTESVIIFRPTYATPAYRGRMSSQGHLNGSPIPSWYTNLNGDQQSLILRGAEAWNRLRPDLPDFTMAASIYELKDMVPLLRDSLIGIVKKVAGVNTQRRKNNQSELSKAGQFYVAAQFGYMPLLRDIQNYVNAQRNSQARLAQLIRDAGKPVRRKTNLTDQSTPQTKRQMSYWGYGSKLSTAANQDPVLISQCYKVGPESGSQTAYSHTSRTWAEGSFRYFLPPGPRDVAWNRKMIKRIMGHRITPNDLYQVIPWSWLLDYYTGLGDFIEATSVGVADRLICDYAYLMQTKEQRFESTSTSRVVVSKDGTKSTLLTSSLITSRIVKRRCEASPFGWGLKQTDLKPQQVAILGALGLSMLP